MSYIRTKDTIYKVVEENDLVYRVIAKKDKSKVYSKSKITTDIIGKSDTLEELCDEFVDIYNYGKPSISLLNDVYAFESYKARDVYGAIWTDKGLIYVAKFNNKGVLELL